MQLPVETTPCKSSGSEGDFHILGWWAREAPYGIFLDLLQHILYTRIVEIKQLEVNVLVVSLMHALGHISLMLACFFFFLKGRSVPVASAFIHLIVRLNPSIRRSAKQTRWRAGLYALICCQTVFVMEWVMSFTLRFLKYFCVSEAERTDALTFHSSPPEWAHDSWLNQDKISPFLFEGLFRSF